MSTLYAPIFDSENEMTDTTETVITCLSETELQRLDAADLEYKLYIEDQIGGR